MGILILDFRRKGYFVKAIKKSYIIIAQSNDELLMVDIVKLFS